MKGLSFIESPGEIRVILQDEIEMDVSELKGDIARRVHALAPVNIVFDLTKLMYLNSSGIGMIIYFHGLAGEMQRHISVLTGSETMRKIFAASKIDTFIEVH